MIVDGHLEIGKEGVDYFKSYFLEIYEKQHPIEIFLDKLSK